MNMNMTKAYLLLTATGPILILTKHESIEGPRLLELLKARTFDKFIAHEVPTEAVKNSYSAHFEHALNDPKETDDLRVLDDDGEQVFKNISFKSLGAPFYYDGTDQ